MNEIYKNVPFFVLIEKNFSLKQMKTGKYSSLLKLEHEIQWKKNLIVFFCICNKLLCFQSNIALVTCRYEKMDTQERWGETHQHQSI